MHSAYEKYAMPPPAKTFSVWLETTVITLAAMLLGYVYSPADSLLVQADFPWLLFAPLLVAVRYGFLPGLFILCCVTCGL